NDFVGAGAIQEGEDALPLAMGGLRLFVTGDAALHVRVDHDVEIVPIADGENPFLAKENPATHPPQGPEGDVAHVAEALCTVGQEVSRPVLPRGGGKGDALEEVHGLEITLEAQGAE